MELRHSRILQKSLSGEAGPGAIYGAQSANLRRGLWPNQDGQPKSSPVRSGVRRNSYAFVFCKRMPKLRWIDAHADSLARFAVQIALGFVLVMVLASLSYGYTAVHGCGLHSRVVRDSQSADACCSDPLKATALESLRKFLC